VSEPDNKDSGESRSSDARAESKPRETQGNDNAKVAVKTPPAANSARAPTVRKAVTAATADATATAVVVAVAVAAATATSNASNRRRTRNTTSPRTAAATAR